MFREELKSCEESRILLGKRFTSVQGFSESDTEISREVTGVCVIFIKNLQHNRHLHGLPAFRYKVISIQVY